MPPGPPAGHPPRPHPRRAGGGQAGPEGAAAVIKVGHDFCGIRAPLQALENAQVNFEHVFSADSNKFCQAITQKFFPPTSCFYEDVLSRDNKSAPYVDLLVFGPPCQPWSSAGLGGGLKLSLIHTSDPTRLRRLSNAVFRLKKNILDKNTII